MKKGSLWSSGLSSDNSTPELTPSCYAKSLLNSQKDRGTMSPQTIRSVVVFAFRYLYSTEMLYLLSLTCSSSNPAPKRNEVT